MYSKTSIKQSPTGNGNRLVGVDRFNTGSTEKDYYKKTPLYAITNLLMYKNSLKDIKKIDFGREIWIKF